MSSRRRWLVAYDIRDEIRLRKVYDIVRSHGDRLQYSVFICLLSPIEKIELMAGLQPVIDHRQDSIVLIDLGEPGRQNSATVEYMGTAIKLPYDGPTII